MEVDEGCSSKSVLVKAIGVYDELNSNSVEVFMSSTKKKLNQKYLYSVRYKGYSLSEKEH